MNPTQALRRLEKASSQGARVTQRLRASSDTLADHVIGLLREADALGDELPRGYRVRRRQYSPGMDWRILCPPQGAPLNGRHDDMARESLLRFADDVADGWLDELSAWLEERATQTVTAASTIEEHRPDTTAEQ